MTLSHFASLTSSNLDGERCWCFRSAVEISLSWLWSWSLLTISGIWSDTFLSLIIGPFQPSLLSFRGQTDLGIYTDVESWIIIDACGDIVAVLLLLLLYFLFFYLFLIDVSTIIVLFFEWYISCSDNPFHCGTSSFPFGQMIHTLPEQCACPLSTLHHWEDTIAISLLIYFLLWRRYVLECFWSFDSNTPPYSLPSPLLSVDTLPFLDSLSRSERMSYLSSSWSDLEIIFFLSFSFFSLGQYYSLLGSIESSNRVTRAENRCYAIFST